MKSMPDYHRRSIRLDGYDYTQPGAYFVTIVVHQRSNLLGKIVNGDIQLSRFGQIVEACWRALPVTFFVEIDEYVIMPNHFHGILMILDEGRADFSQGKASGDHSNILPSSDLPDALPHPLNPHTIGNTNLNPLHGTTSGSLNAVVQNFKSVSTMNQRHSSNTACPILAAQLLRTNHA
jgi:putative transposase